MAEAATEENVLVSYITLRRVVGILGVGLPIIVAIWGFFLCGCGDIRFSISAYYETRTGDAFVGILFVIAWFLFTYRGYERQDDRAGDFACFCALGVALFPSSGGVLEKVIHFLSAAGLFFTLSYFALYIFTKSSEHLSPQKLTRNRIYRACGVIILICIALIGLIGLSNLLFGGTFLAALKPAFWLASLALWAFGFSWFIKGETLFRDAVTA